MLVIFLMQLKGCEPEWSSPTPLNIPPPPLNLEMLVKCVSEAAQNVTFPNAI